MKRFLIVAALLLMLAPAVARAGTYDVVACTASGGGPINRAWTIEPYNSSGEAAPPFSAFAIPSVESCGTGVTFGSAVAQTTVKADDGAAWTFHAPAGTTVKNVTLSRDGNARASADDPGTPVSEGNWWTTVARAGSSAGGETILGDLCPGSAPIVYPAYCSTGSGAITFTDVDQPVFSWGIQCVGSSAALCFTSDPGQASVQNATAEFQGARVTVEDLVAPDTGSDVGTAWRRPEGWVTAGADDSAGIRSGKVFVDGTERPSVTFGCDFHLAAPCRTTWTALVVLSDLAEGRHVMTVVAEDPAGNVGQSEHAIDIDATPPVLDLLSIQGSTIRATVTDAASGLWDAAIEVRQSPTKPWERLKTTVADGRMSASASGASKLGIRLLATDNAGNSAAVISSFMSLGVRVGRHDLKVRDSRASVPFGRDAVLTGDLTTTDGAALMNQPLSVTAQLRLTGAGPEPYATALTDGSSRFSIPVPAGPSRNFIATYPGSDGVLHTVGTISVRVPASSTIHAGHRLVSRGGSVRFTGHLRTLGATLPPGGKLVDLQISRHGHWRTEATTRATASGWRAVARFRGTPGRYPVRLRIRREAVFPYDLGYSPSVIVRVR